jgi:hypothetical protein
MPTNTIYTLTVTNKTVRIIDQLQNSKTYNIADLIFEINYIIDEVYIYDSNKYKLHTLNVINCNNYGFIKNDIVN